VKSSGCIFTRRGLVRKGFEHLSSDVLTSNEYSLAGLTVISDIVLHGVPLGGPVEPRDVVRIRRAAVPDQLPGALIAGGDMTCSEHEVLLHVPEVARFLVRDGSEILVDPEPTAEESWIRVYLLGSAFGVLCHQRGILPLHSAAIDTADGCIAFVGESGAGKSTLAAALASRGHQVITDDVSFLKRGDANNQNIMSWPGLARIRLWDDALTALGVDASNVEREAGNFDKFLLPVTAPKNVFSPRRLSRIYRLDITDTVKDTGIRRVEGASVMELLMQNVYRLHLAESMGRTPAIFQFCADIATRIPIFDFSRPLEFATLNESLDLLEAHFRLSNGSL
jgi:hypothetical protein